MPIVVRFDAPEISSDAGVLPLWQLDDELGLTAGFAACLTDDRDPDRVPGVFEEAILAARKDLARRVRPSTRHPGRTGVPPDEGEVPEPTPLEQALAEATQQQEQGAEQGAIGFGSGRLRQRSRRHGASRSARSPVVMASRCPETGFPRYRGSS